jgi:hypothetical protein
MSYEAALKALQEVVTLGLPEPSADLFVDVLLGVQHPVRRIWWID